MNLLYKVIKAWNLCNKLIGPVNNLYMFCGIKKHEVNYLIDVVIIIKIIINYWIIKLKKKLFY